MTGVDRHAIEILRSIDALIGDHHPLTIGITLDILCAGETANVSPFANVPQRILPRAPGHVWEQLILPRYVGGGLLSLCNSGPLATKKQIVCIHDVNTRLVPQSYSFAFRTVYGALHPLLGRRAMQIVTVSHFSQQGIARFGIAPTDETKVIHNGYEHVLRWNGDRSPLKQAEIPKPFVLVVGSRASHKNTSIIYSIAAELGRRGIHIVLTGGADSNVYMRSNDSRLPTNVRRLGRVDDDDLAFLYQRALCLVFPSLTEGFGLPALEAMAFGCPVISSGMGSLPEVCGPAALYAPPHDGPAWLSAITKIAGEPLLRERLSKEGQKRLETFTWRRSAEQYLELMFTLDNASEDGGQKGHQTARNTLSA